MPRISDSIGRVLGARYRLVAALGSGASAHVYLAEDLILQRPVAVKVLQPGLARDEGFLRRFRAEARAVAVLNHPNVLRVFDWGEDADGPYLVVEHLGGGSLRHLLDRGARLDAAQAAALGTQVGDALAHAHARGLVHRDVKPANLLFDEEGRVRVADFGVARALAEAAATEPAGAMIGTARYASPEQAEGRSVDGKTDVYSLALVLYEALTGQVPFTADSTAATLRARIGARLPPHPSLGPLGDVLDQATAPDPGDRIDAATFAARLAALPLGTPAPLPIAPGPSPVPAPPPSEGTAVPAPGAGAPAPGTGTVAPPGFGLIGGSRPFSPSGNGPGSPPVVGSATAVAPAVSAGGLGALSAPRSRRPERRRWPWVLVAAVVVLAAAGAAFAVVTKAFVPSHRVPSLAGASLADARKLATTDHFTLSVAAAVRSTTVPAGSVVRQEPPAGSSLKQGDTLTVVPSAGPPTVPVPSLAGGLTCTAAERLLAEAHLQAACPALSAYTDTVPDGEVINWSYATRLDPAHAPYGATIQIAVSLGHHPVKVPSLGSDSYTQAAAALKAVGLVASEAQTYSTTVPSGQVIATTPAVGLTAPYGSTVEVRVSKGPQTVTVPDLGGDTVAQATAALAKAQLTLGPVYGPAGGTVFASLPASGEQVKVGTAVTLYTA